MTVKAGTIMTVAGHSVIQRLQRQGLGNVKIPINTVREIGNNLVVDQVPQEPEFTFALESYAVDSSIEAILHGATATGSGSTQGAGAADSNGTEYKWETCGAINICSPWKDPQSFGSGNVIAGYIVPGYFPSKIAYKFGVTEDSAITAELRGGTFFAGSFAPTEDLFTGTGSQTAFVTAEAAVEYRRGGVLGSTFQNALGVIVDGIQQVEGEDFTVTGGGAAGSNTVATVTFLIAPANAAKIRIAYFTTSAHAYPDAVHESSVVLPGAVRGRNICVSLASGGSSNWEKIYGIQTATLDASFDITPERELCNDELVGFTVNGTNCNGVVTVHAKDATAFFNLVHKITGVDTAHEVVGFINRNTVKLKIEIMDPRSPATPLKTLYVPDAIFDIPGADVRVNTVVDFALNYESLNGTYSAFKGTAAI